MRSEDDVHHVFELWGQGWSKQAISRETGVSRAQVRVWIEKGIEVVLASPMRAGRCGSSCDLPARAPPAAYAYLLGQYLGDGCISEASRHVFRLRIVMCDDYPSIRDECELAIHLVMPGHRIGRVKRLGCSEVYGYSKHWPCLLPQHGPGRKHERKLILAPWQERIAYDLSPQFFLRGLVHADGCRVINRVTGQRTGKRYEYPRYFFTNESSDIREFFVEACRRLHVHCRYTKPNTLSVARREHVGVLDTFVGAKA
ncbi:MAG TPA: transcriptional regulator [Acidimicrobiia bacterium]